MNSGLKFLIIVMYFIESFVKFLILSVPVLVYENVVSLSI
jgi:hypothetical protein